MDNISSNPLNPVVYGDQLTTTNSIISRENVSQETLDKYNQLLQDIQAILKKNPPSQNDADQLAQDLTDLQALQKNPGLTTDMNLIVNLLSASVDKIKDSSGKINPSLITILNQNATLPVVVYDETEKKDKVVNMPLIDALGVIAQPNYFVNATKTLGDILLDTSKWIYDQYTTKLKDLQQQIDIAKAAITDLKALQDILNQVTVDQASNYKFPPTCWDDIPAELQEKLRKENPSAFANSANINPNSSDYLKTLKKVDPKLYNEILRDQGYIIPITGHGYTPTPKFKSLSTDDQNKVLKALGGEASSGPPTDWSSIDNWIKKHADTYANWSTDYFKEEAHVIASPQPDSITAANNAIKARDDLIKQLKELDACSTKDNPIDKGDGSAYATIDQAIKDIETRFPITTYPEGSQIAMNTATPAVAVVMKSDGTQGASGVDYEGAIKGYIMDGQDKDKQIAGNLDKAVQANQTLSSTVSDKLKAENLNLQTYFDILTQISDALNKIIQGTAQKINR